MSDEIKSKIAAARARRQAAEEKREEQTPADLEQELAREEQAAADAEALAKAEAEYGRLGNGKLASVTTDVGLVLLKRPNAIKFKAFIDNAEDVKHQDAERLVRDCVVYPSKDKFDAMIAEQPGIVGGCSLAVARLAGVQAKAISGKP